MISGRSVEAVEKGRGIPKVASQQIRRDFVLNIVGTAVFTMALQVAAYPFLSRQMSASEYGQLLLVMGIVNAAGTGFGGALNNSRLIRKLRYEQAGMSGDFGLIRVGSGALCMVTVGVAMIFIIDSLATIAAFTAISLMVFFRAYYSVSFRLVVNYSKMLRMHLAGACGVLAGIGLSSLTGFWPTVFLVGEAGACAYLIANAPEVRESVRKTTFFGESLRLYFALAGSALMASTLMYLDRFLLFPLLGAPDVAVFVVAGYLGKSAGVFLTPIASVMLTYYAREQSLGLRALMRQAAFFSAVCALVFALSYGLSGPVAQLLYPTLAESSRPYFMVANLGAALFILGNMMHPAQMRFCSARSVVLVQASYLALFLGLSTMAAHTGGLIAFCWAVVGANLFRAIVVFWVVFLYAIRLAREGR